MNDSQLAEMLFAAATDHRYIQIGHVADFTNKALEALDAAGWEHTRAEMVLSSLANGYVNASRQEESNAWRNPIDLVEILERAFEQLPNALSQGTAGPERSEGTNAEDASSSNMRDDLSKRKTHSRRRDDLIPILLGDEPQEIVDALLGRAAPRQNRNELAGIVAYAAALRIARFHTSNEFGDWDTALHTFTFANAIHQAIRRIVTAQHPSPHAPNYCAAYLMRQ